MGALASLRFFLRKLWTGHRHSCTRDAAQIVAREGKKPEFMLTDLVRSKKVVRRSEESRGFLLGSERLKNIFQTPSVSVLW